MKDPSARFTGFRIGALLGPYAAIHRGNVAAIAPAAAATFRHRTRALIAADQAERLVRIFV
jgi:hypothetical protein